MKAHGDPWTMFRLTPTIQTAYRILNPPIGKVKMSSLNTVTGRDSRSSGQQFPPFGLCAFPMTTLMHRPLGLGFRELLVGPEGHYSHGH